MSRSELKPAASSSKQKDSRADDTPALPPPPETQASKAKKIHRYSRGASPIAPRESPRPIITTTHTNPKLEELRLAFGSLAREIQGLDGDGRHGDEAGASPCLQRGTGSAFGEGRGGTECSAPGSATTTMALPWGGGTHTRSTPPLRSTEVLPPTKRPSKMHAIKSVELSATPTNKALKSKAQAISRHHVEQNLHMDGTKRLRAAAYAEGRNAAEAAARGTKQALKRVQMDLEAEKRSRTAAESALQDLQLRAAESEVEREKLARVVNSFGGRSLEELTAGSGILERRARETERALTEARQLANAKATESLEALERAADLGEALEKERAARLVAEDARENLTQDLRSCLRGRAVAEDAALAASKALKVAEAQKESLGQRLQILRAANKRLDKRAAAAVAGAGAGSICAKDTAVRLAAARARLRTLSASELKGGGGGGFGVVREMQAVERGRKAVVAEKKWKGKLREMEAQGEVLKSALQAAVTGMQRATKEKVELQEVNRILAMQLASSSSIESADVMASTNRGARPVVAMGVENASGVLDEVNTTPIRPDVQHGSRSHSSDDVRIAACAAAGAASRVDCGKSSPAHRAWPVASSGGDAAVEAAPIAARSNHTCSAVGLFGKSSSTTAIRNMTQQSALNQAGAAKQTTSRNESPWLSRQTVRSNSLDATESGSSSGRCNPARPRSASEAIPPGRDAPRRTSRQHIAASEAGSFVSYYDQLLSDSRRLREEVLSTVRDGPWHENTRDSTAQIPPPHERAQEGHVDVSLAAEGPEDARLGVRATVPSVPIAVLLRLCDRSARCVRDERAGIPDDVGVKRDDTAWQVYRYEDAAQRGRGPSSPGPAGGEPQPELEPAVEDSSVLHPGISAALAQEVQGAVSQGDERRFLEILGRCGSTAKGGIARLLSIDAPKRFSTHGGTMA